MSIRGSCLLPPHTPVGREGPGAAPEGQGTDSGRAGPQRGGGSSCFYSTAQRRQQIFPARAGMAGRGGTPPHGRAQQERRATTLVAEMFASSLDRTERKFRGLLPTASPGYRPVVGGSDDDGDDGELGRGTGLSRQQARDGGKVVGAASPSQVAASLGAGSKGGGDGSSGPAITDLEGGGGRGGAYAGPHDPRAMALRFPLAQPQPEPEQGGEKEEAGPAGAGARTVTSAESRPSPLRDRVACCRVDGAEGESSGGKGGGDAQAGKAVVASDGTKMLPPPPWFREGGWRLRACKQATPASVFIVAGGVCFIIPLLMRSNCHFSGPHHRHARLTAVCFAFGVAICWGCVVHVTGALPKLLPVDDPHKGPLYAIGRRPSGKPQLLSPEALQTLGHLRTISHLICLAMAAWFVGLVRWCSGTLRGLPCSSRDSQTGISS
eukprot:COSAG01_NODE_6690_length_3541_cov_2.209471_3_plen_436_part_00